MIYKQTRFDVMDNTGALEVELIGSFKKRKYSSSVGDLIMVAVKRAVAKKKVKIGDVKQALIVQTRKKIIRFSQGYDLKFMQNQVVIMGKFDAPLGTRLKGVVTQELRVKKQVKTMTMSSYLI
jgi:large subunit ribosomal protein L14